METAPPAACCRCGGLRETVLPGDLCATCFGADLFAEDVPGLPFTRIGDYELLEEIGRGGMGLVYRARQISLGRPAAVKLILTGPLASAMERQRFVAEASAAAALDHPGIVAVYDAGEEDGQPFFAMQLIEGDSLSAQLAGKNSPWDPREAAAFIRQVALSIQHAHERGFLHRDLKPANLLIDRSGVPHITDFGLARRLDDDSALTLTGTALGTPSYMAPEQTDTRQPATTAVDIYGLGAILYELLSGHPPFRASSLPELFMAIREKDAPSLAAGQNGVDRDLDIICRKCLEKDPSRRYRSSQALADDLEAWLQGETISARAAGPAERMLRWCRRRPAIAGLSAAALLLFLAGTSGILTQWQRANREATAARTALQRAEEALWQANWSEARALRISRERGQRIQSLHALKAAAAFRVSPELRQEAIAALALPDVGPPDFQPDLPPGSSNVRTNRAADRIVFATPEPSLRLRAVSSPETLAVIPAPRMDRYLADASLTQLLVLQDRSGNSCRAVLWKLPASGPPLMAGEFADITGAALAADGSRLILCTTASRLEVRDTVSGALLSGSDLPWLAMDPEFSPDGTQLLLWPAGSAAAELWSLDPPARHATLPKLPSPIESVRPHPWDGSWFVATQRETLHLRPGAGKVDRLVTHDREGIGLWPHPSGLFVASSSWDGIVRFTVPGLNGDLLRTSGFRPLGFSADGQTLLTLTGLRIGVSSVKPMEAWRAMPVRADEEAALQAVEPAPDNKSIAVVSRASAAFFDPETLQFLTKVPLPEGTAGVWAPDGSLLVSQRSAGLSRITLTRIAQGWMATPPVPVLTSSGPPAVFRGLALNREGNQLAVMLPEGVGLFDLTDRSRRRFLTGQPLLSHCTWSPDSRWIATGYWNNSVSGGAEATVFSSADGSVVTRLPAGSCIPAFTPDGRRLFLGSTHEYVEWDTGTWKELRRHPREASGLDQGLTAISEANGLIALQASESVLRLVRLDDGREVARLEQPGAPKITRLSWSPDGRWLVVTAGQAIRLWDLPVLRRQLHEIGLDWQ